MSYILCNNSWEGVCFLMSRALKKDGLIVDIKNLRDDPKFFKKYNIGTCPVLLCFNNSELHSKITGVQEIIKELKNAQINKL